nr:MAG TPA: Sarcoglycan alpha/epsilon [Caudoviricetes sp.]
MSEDRKRYGFWAFAADNPIMIIILMVIVLGLIAIMCGYREGFASVLTGLFGFMKKDDTDRRLEEKALEVKKIEAGNRILEDAVPMAWARHDEEVEDNVQSAKAYCDELDIDELVDLGNAMLRDAGSVGGEA